MSGHRPVAGYSPGTKTLKARVFFERFIFFLMALSFVVTGVVWRWNFAPGAASRLRGVNALLHTLGLDAFVGVGTSTQVPSGLFTWH